MTLKEPESMEEVVYYTRRDIDSGSATVWVFKEKCTSCEKAFMGKPKDPKTGKPKIRAKEYVCPECENTVEKTAYEETLTANIRYVCPFCKNDSEIQVPFKRKRIKGADTLRFQCQKCGENIDVTKKMKKVK